MHRRAHPVPVLVLVVAAGAVIVACSSSKSDKAAVNADAASGGGSPTGGASDGGDTASDERGVDAAPGSGGAAAGAAGSADADGGITAGVPVRDFLESLGVCTHIGQGVDSAPETATAMVYAGLHNLRDDGSASVVPSWITVHQQSGARVSLLTNQDVASTIDMAKQLNAAGALLAVEGPNEPNNFPVTYAGQTSNGTTFLPVAKLQRDLYAAVKAEPSLDGIPVFHSSEAGGSEPDDMGLQFLSIPAGAGAAMPDGTRYADYANAHNYIVGHSAKLSDNLCWNAADPTLNGDWDGLYVEYGKTWRGHYDGYSNVDLQTLQRVTTETGWVTTGTGSITQEQQGRLFLNLYLAAFKRGWSYTFIYMLRDDPNQGYWGLFDISYKPKTSGTYLHNLTTILVAPGSTRPSQPDYSIASPPPTVHDLLMQKNDGTFDLAVWDERPSGGSDDITLSFAAAHPTVDVYDPTTGTSPTQSLTNVTSVGLTLSDHPVIVAF
jgi:hypothetical protein